MARKLIVEIVGDARQFEKSLRKAGADTRSFATKSTSTGKRLAKAGLFAGAAVGVGALGAAFKTGLDEFTEAQKVSAQTAAVLKSTGKQAGVTAKHVDDLAGSIMSYSGIDDEAIKSGENLLLTFTNLRNGVGKGNQVFDQATTLMADMSTALGQDMKTSAIQLGKALNDPIKGVGALRRVGVSFTDDQKKQIKTLVESGKTMEAQKIILGELTKEFGGSAKAAGDTFAGKLNILKQSFNNLAGEVMAGIMPTLTKLLDKANKWISNAENQKKVVDAVKDAFAALKTGIDIIVGAFKVLKDIVGGNRQAILLLIGAYAAWKVAKIAGSVANLARQFGLLATNTTRATTAAGGGGGLGALGKATSVVGAAAAGYGITSTVLQATGLDKKLAGLGARAAGGLNVNKGLLPGAAYAIQRLEQTRGISHARATDIVMHSHVYLDGAQVAHSVNRHNARGAHRTAAQTSGRAHG